MTVVVVEAVAVTVVVLVAVVRVAARVDRIFRILYKINACST
jgi:hypothetical protein